MNRCWRCLLIISSVSITLALPSRSRAASPVAVKTDTQLVRQVLTWETLQDSVDVDRRGTLRPAVNPAVASNAAWWQSGFVKVGDSWRHAEIAPDDIEPALWNEYRAVRDAAEQTPQAQLKLSNWCQSHKLPDQERAHLTQVIVLAGTGFDRTPVYMRMGYRPWGEHWVSPAEFQDLQTETRRNDEQLARWRPALERIVRNWGGTAKQRKRAQDELSAMKDATAVGTMVAAASLNESLALAICEQLGSLQAFESSRGLAMISVQSDWRSVREAAIESLKGRRIDDFAPALLHEMRSSAFTIKPDDGAAEPRLIFREESDRYVTIDLRFLPGGVTELRDFISPGTVTSRVPATSNIALARGRLLIDGARYIDDVDQQIQRRIESENDRTDEYNRRAAATLAAVSGQEFSANPNYWWAWWHLHTGTDLPPKGTEIRFVKAQLPSTVTVTPVPLFARAGSCLVAGTPVKTDRGLVPIDQIRIGDRVLAKHVATGEIAYKPVVHTTVRKPVPVRKFVVAGSPVVASEGHHFWVSGTGWSKTRDMKEGLPIHTATGMARVESAENLVDIAPVYNLVVADFHTYFIGTAMVLSHDVLAPSPTNIKVPGLDAD